MHRPARASAPPPSHRCGDVRGITACSGWATSRRRAATSDVCSKLATATPCDVTTDPSVKPAHAGHRVAVSAVWQYSADRQCSTRRIQNGIDSFHAVSLHRRLHRLCGPTHNVWHKHMFSLDLTHMFSLDVVPTLSGPCACNCAIPVLVSDKHTHTL